MCCFYQKQILIKQFLIKKYLQFSQAIFQLTQDYAKLGNI